MACRYSPGGRCISCTSICPPGVWKCGWLRSSSRFIGSDGLELADISELPLDDLHTLVRTSWNLRMRNEPPRDPVCLRSTFLLRKDDGVWRIALYLNHQDMTKLFHELAR